jgi:hypothetical protein
MYKRLNSFIEKNNILSNEQLGFRQGKLADKVCHTFLNNIQEAKENKHQGGYEVLNHQILLDKLEKYEIRGLGNK